MITQDQIRACKAILRWSFEKLADESKISISTLKRIEGSDEQYMKTTVETLKAIREAFEKTKRVSIVDESTLKIHK